MQFGTNHLGIYDNSLNVFNKWLGYSMIVFEMKLNLF
jgi:hypothetical protein